VATVFINEFHYDNTSTDSGEFIEIAGPAGTDLTSWSLVLYNGSDGSVYDTQLLSEVIPDQGNGFGTVVISYPSNDIQNGSPDGVALVDNNGAVVQFLSYEGSFTAVGGPADGLTSTDIGVAESDSTPAGFSLQLTGAGNLAEDFTWVAPAAETPASVNTNQTFVPLDNIAPTLTSFSGVVDVTTEETAVEITFADLQAAGDEADTDGTVTAFLVQAVTSSGTLSIGTDPLSATPWAPGTNDSIRATTNAYWTPNPNVNGAVPAFSVVAQDDLGATSSAPVVASVEVTPTNDDPFIGGEPLALYDVGSAATPQDDLTVPNGPALAFANLALDPTFGIVPGSATESFTGVATQLDTTGDDSLGTTGNGIYAGYSNYDLSDQLINAGTFPSLDRTSGYLISFDLKVNDEANTDFGSDKNLDGLPDRAGFSVIAISSDGQYGIELGFETDRIWAQEDGTGQVEPSLEPDPLDANTSDRTLFTQAEGVNFATNNSSVNYDLLVQGNAYTLYADGASILSGRLRDYTALEGAIDPYENPNFLFFGDNTPSARGRVDIGDIAVITAAGGMAYSATFDAATDLGETDADGVLVASAPTLADIDGDAIASVTATLTNSQNDLGERLFLSGTYPNVTYTLDTDDQITVTNAGGATPDEMAAAITAIRYQNNDGALSTRDRTVTLDASDGISSSQTASTISVVSDTPPPFMLINEIDSDTLGTDTAEFIELYDGGVGNTSLDGLVVVLFNGNGDASYSAFDLDGFSTDANGFFVLGNPDVPNVDFTFNTGLLQNGADAVALYAADATDFPNGTLVTTTNLLDAVVYSNTSTTVDTGLLPLLNAGQSQLNEGANGQSDTQSLQRFPNGAGSQRSTDSFIVGAPSPGLANAATIEFTAATFTSAEGDGNATVTLTRSNGSGQSTVEVTISGGSAIGGSTATADYDNTGFPLLVTFEDGITSQTFEIPLVDDATVEGDETVELSLANPTNAYVGEQAIATLTITDNDVAGFAIAETDGNTTVNEAGDITDTFTVQLDSQPLTDVKLTVTSGDTAEATVAPTTLTFTPENWDQAQTVTVSGVDDVVLDGPQNSTVTIAVDAAASDDAFDNLASQTVTVTTTDDDIADFSIVESEGSTTVSESGTSDPFTVQLDRQPLTDVELTVTSGDPGEVTAAPTLLTFTPDNWDQAQTVTVTGVEDEVADGAQVTNVVVSVNPANSDATFDGVADQVVTVTTTDNDTPGVSFTETEGTSAVSEDGATDTYDIVLDSQPESDVVITVTSVEGQLSPTPTTLTFTPQNWDQAQTVTVAAVDDNAIEGGHTGTISHSATSADSNYEGLAIADLSVAITDNDTAAIVVTQSDGTTAVTEGGATDSYEIVLTAMPTADVVVTVVADDETTLSDTTLTFDASNWNQPQAITVTAVDDEAVEGSHTSVITHTVSSSDTNFDALSVADVTVAVTDNDVAGFSIIETDDDTTVSESGSTDTFDVRLDSRPLTNVELTVTSGDLSEATVTPIALTFTPDNWDQVQTVTVQGEDDIVVDGPQSSVVTVGVKADTSDAAFAALPDQTVTVMTTDDDSAGFSIAETEGTTTVDETGTTDTFTVVLDQQPLSDVEFSVTSGDAGEAIATPTLLTFTPENWNTPQEVTVTGQDDAIADGPQNSLITVSVNAATSDDAFDSLASQSVSVITTDDDVVGATLNQTNGNTVVSEGGTSDSYTVVLDSQPTDTVTVALTADDEITLNKTSLTFTPTNWDQAQTVIVTAVNDDVVEGPHTGTVSHSVTSNDPQYSGVEIADITVEINDNDSVGLTVNQSNGATNVTEAGGTDGYTIVLNTQPSADVVVALSPDEQATLSESELRFTPSNWNTPQTVTVTAIDDEVAEGPHTATITHVVNSSDPEYDGFAIADVVANVTDNDTAGVTVQQSNNTTLVTEAGGTDGYSIVLNSAPTDNVIISLLSDGQTSLSQSTLTFTPDNWNQAQTVTVTAIDDPTVEGPHTSAIAHSITSNDAQYSSLIIDDVVASITDNDNAGFTLSQLSATVSEDGSTPETLMIKLDGAPLSPVILNIANSNPEEVAVDTTTITLDSSNWDTGVPVQIQGVSDDIVDDDQTTTLTISVDDASSDNAFDTLPNQEVTVTTVDTNTAEAVLSADKAAVSEAGDTDTYTVALTSRPTADVTFTFEGGDQLITPEPITFTPDNWDQAQTVTIAAIDDEVFEGEHTGLLTQTISSNDTNFDGIEVAPITVAIADNDSAGLLLSKTDVTVSEAGTTDIYTLALISQPTTDVTVIFDGGEQLETPLPLTFTPDNWDQAQTVTVAAIDDETFEGDHTGTLVQSVSSNDANYEGIEVTPITAAIADNDRPTDLIFSFDQFVTFQVIDEGIFPSFDEELYLIANPDVQAAVASGAIASGAQHYEQFGRVEGRSLLPLGLEIGGLRMANFYDETYYLSQNPDVADAVSQGTFANGYEHFLRFGIAEGRNPSRFYDEALYLTENPDVQAAVDDNSFSSGLAHYLQFGHIENRVASSIFDPDDYLLANPDVAAAVEQGGFLSAFEHFLEAGARESRLPVLLFEELTYLEQNPDVAAAVANNEFPSGYDHYVTFGQQERRDPSVSFDESAYLSANPDVAIAVNNGELSSGMEHYFRFGRAEDRPLV